MDEDDIFDEVATPTATTERPSTALVAQSSKKQKANHTSTKSTTATGEEIPLTLNPSHVYDITQWSESARTAACFPTTVHWDPDSPDGRKVGWRVWVHGRTARVTRYDPHTHKHLLQWDNADGDCWTWLRNVQHNLRVATRIVWAQVKGYAWWPALVTESVVEGSSSSSTTREGFVELEFFGTGETASLRDTDDFIRPFDPENLDPVVAKHRKKRNQRSFQLAADEFATILKVRNEAALFYAQASLSMAAWRGPKLIGKATKGIPAVGHRVRVFRSDVNYPYGDTIIGVVRQYSTAQKKWLVAFDDGTKYPAAWLNLLAKEHSLKILQNAKRVTGPETLLPYLFGYVPTATSNEYASLLANRCHACAQAVPSSESQGKSSLAHELTVVCSGCEATYHIGCLDPPMSLAQWQRMARDDTDFICSRCTVCRGCYQKDIVWGTHPHSNPPANVSLPPGSQLTLCGPCREHYDAQRYCPNCAHVWNDAKYYLWRKELPNSRTTGDLVDDPNNLVFGSFPSDELPLDFKLDPKLFYPETSVWGYTEDDMLVCDGCNVWLHARCSGLTPEEYKATSNGKHPIYSVEFLCYMCCQARCRTIVQELKKEDRTMLFAVPVSEKDVPNYYDLIKDPMDLSTMETRVETEGSLNYVWVRENFELMVLNALRFNRYVRLLLAVMVFDEQALTFYFLDPVYSSMEGSEKVLPGCNAERF